MKVINKDLKISDKNLFFILDYFNYFIAKSDKEICIDKIIKETQRLRKKQKDKEIKNKSKKEKYVGVYEKELGINLYEIRSPRVKHTINYLIEKGYLKEKENKLSISKFGINYLNNIYTNNYCGEYFNYKNKAEEALDKRKMPSLKERCIMNCYYHKKSLEEVIKIYGEWGAFYRVISMYQRHILEKLGYNQEFLKDKYIFNFIPKLFIPIELLNLKSTDFTLEIQGIANIPNNFKLKKPYPNKRYIIPSYKIGKEICGIGFFPIIAKKEDFPKKLKVKLIWTIKNSFKFTHDLTFNFIFKNKYGNMFCNMQHSFNIENSFMDELRDVKEEIDLYNFHMENNHNFIVDTNFEKFNSKIYNEARNKK